MSQRRVVTYWGYSALEEPQFRIVTWSGEDEETGLDADHIEVEIQSENAMQEMVWHGLSEDEEVLAFQSLCYELVKGELILLKPKGTN